jgi:hypothetical protein
MDNRVQVSSIQAMLWYHNWKFLFSHSSVQLGLKILGLHSWLSSVSSMFEDDKKLGE